MHYLTIIGGDITVSNAAGAGMAGLSRVNTFVISGGRIDGRASSGAGQWRTNRTDLSIGRDQEGVASFAGPWHSICRCSEIDPLCSRASMCSLRLTNTEEPMMV
jgi:hypothetical protein